MTWFVGGIEQTPSRPDVNCSRCTSWRLPRKKPFKAKWRVKSPYIGGRVNVDGTAAEPWTKDEYERLWELHGGMEGMLKATGTKRVDWAEMCGHCRNRHQNRQEGLFTQTAASANTARCTEVSQAEGSQRGEPDRPESIQALPVTHQPYETETSRYAGPGKQSGKLE